MFASHRELNRVPGLCYALTEDGLELPVIDLTHPAFQKEWSEAELSRLRRSFARGLWVRERLPGFLRARLVRFLEKRSVLLRAGLANRRAQGAPRVGEAPVFMSGTATYLMKLGPELLGSYASRLDRKLAATLPPIGLRLRLCAMARLLAESLAQIIAPRAGDRVDILDVGGGPAMDALNALLLLRHSNPRLLAERRITVHVLDRDDAGPRFGARALAALTAANAPLDGLDVTLHHVAHDWERSDTLPARLAEMDLSSSLALGATEGALFDYGSDAAIVGTLSALHAATGPDFVLIGSVCPDTDFARRQRADNHLDYHTRGIAGIARLAEKASWRTEDTKRDALGEMVRLVKQ